MSWQPSLVYVQTWRENGNYAALCCYPCELYMSKVRRRHFNCFFFSYFTRLLPDEIHTIISECRFESKQKD
jgi:hypothetical protein